MHQSPLPRLAPLTLAFLACSSAALAQAPPRPGVLERVGFDQKLGATVPADLTFLDASGKTVQLGDYYGKRPLILIMVYYRCPMLCGKELEGLVRCLRAVAPAVGAGFDVLTVSFDPNESPELAAAKRRATLDAYDRPRADQGWHFLTGRADAIARLAQTIGFRFSPIEGTRDFAHAAGIVVLAPNGLITRYFFGVDFPSKDVQASLQAADAAQVGQPVARWLMLCYEYDPKTGRYTLAIMKITQVLAAITLVALVATVWRLARRDRARRATVAASP
jgi:protein SCO1/2